MRINKDISVWVCATLLSGACSEAVRHDDDAESVGSAGIITAPPTSDTESSSEPADGSGDATLPTSEPVASTSEVEATDTDAVDATSTGVGPGTSTTGPAAPGSTSSGDDMAGMTSGDTGEQPPCAGISVDAVPKLVPVDILLAVDNSGSMATENVEVQVNLNKFADMLATSALDFRLFLVSRYPAPQGKPNVKQIGICVEPPLGIGGCPLKDSNGPFLHIDEYVDSHTALEDMVKVSSIWYPMMRPNSIKHLVVVSDDDAIATSDAALAEKRADAFHALLIGQFVGFFGQYAFHAITGLAGAPCQAIARPGLTYAILAQEIPGERAQGVLGDLCQQDFDPVFAAISESIAAGAELPCELELPAPPMGESFDPDQVNVHLALEGMPPLLLVRVDDAFACGAAQDGMGWYYDDAEAPTKIFLCGAPCQDGQSEGASLAFELGCQTVIPG